MAPIHIAAADGNLEEVMKLVEDDDRNVNRSSYDGGVPLQEACRIGHVMMVKYLLSHGADINRRGSGGSTPLHEACVNAKVRV